METPSNPLLGIADLAGWARIAREAGALLVVDNTFATPFLQQPLTLGADVVVHSTTKYIGGHSDVLGGAVIVAERIFRGQSLAEAVGFQQFAGGAVAGPQDCFLAARGLKTLGLRMERHCSNAARIAEWLTTREEVSTVLYPGLESHPGHELAKTQSRGFGGIVSLQFAGGEAAARAFAESTELFALSVSLGGVESLVCYSSEMTHASVIGTPLAVPEEPGAAQRRRRAGRGPDCRPRTRPGRRAPRLPGCGLGLTGNPGQSAGPPSLRWPCMGSEGAESRPTH